LAGVHQARHATDIGVAMKKLCPTARVICEQLSEGQSINEIANRMGVSWHTVNKHLATIRECFASVGLSELAT
jgi:DNA-binding NarL/FixJ family response regulator